ncbi:MAG: carbohydrate-binding protein [Tannerellaceae bacterium]
MKYLIVSLLICFSTTALPQLKSKEYHVSITGDDKNEGSKEKPLKTISAAAQIAMPGEIITVHEGIYREKIAPPRGGTSDKQRITYQAAPGEKVIITGSEPVSGWQKAQNNTWKITLPNSFFGDNNPFDEQIYGSWYRGKGRPNHTGSVYLNGARIRECFSLEEVLMPVNNQPFWYAEADGNGGDVLMNFEWIKPANGNKKTSMQASVQGGDQSVCIAIVDRWPFGYLKNNSILYFDQVDFGTGTDTLYYQAAAMGKGGYIEMRLDNPNGELLGYSAVSNTGDWEQFEVFHLNMTRKLSGKHSVCFVVKAPEIKPNGQTTIWAQFPQGVNPNEQQVELSVRPQVFYPDKTGIDYITIRGFILENAATNWAPPSAEQPGLVGTRWGKGWEIENNVIRNSRCAGIALGRPTFGHAHHYQKLPPRIYPDPVGGQTEQELKDYFQDASWDKNITGHHRVRNNHIYECGQVGIVGCSGGAFSIIEGNNIHDICVNETFEGDEMAGIKLHFANDVIIRNNHITNCIRGIWLDWGCQGTQVVNNLLHNNGPLEDVFFEVCHGPILLANNILLSPKGLSLSQGTAVVHNLIQGEIGGGVDRCAGGRKSYYYEPHGTVSLGNVLNQGGDWQFYNNLFAGKASLDKWDEPFHPISYNGNVYIDQSQPNKEESGTLIDNTFNSQIQLIEKNNGWYLSMNTTPDWQKKQKRQIVRTKTLGKTVTANQSFTNPDDSEVCVNKDFTNKKRNTSNPSPGPFEISKEGVQEWLVWPQ